VGRVVEVWHAKGTKSGAKSFLFAQGLTVGLGLGVDDELL